MIPHSSKPTAAEASAWADVLVRRRLLQAAGQWLNQDRPERPVRILSGPADVVAQAATIQHRNRSTRSESR
ncbi:hypothetical protein [uncultured Streptomyces sp.]|uniref:hypothetical protein n=1 Tax=uncultured Streptomyces sp. TaxID=174707 RepID=UPI00261DFAE9|nr:hypothetical protein [uncultured Streptomyces sp.]